MPQNTVHHGRRTARIEGDFVVFLIGIRFNKLWKVRSWLGPFMAMPRMLSDLRAHPEKGLLGVRMSMGGRTISLVQYWRSFEQLEAFARNTDDPHLASWRAFNRTVGDNGDVGIFHETYRVHAGDHESVYVNMPVMGLAEAGESVQLGKGRDTARTRLSRR
ncbi:DUF4188 domain-containing protein [Williamsia sp. M5A3_1d]